MTSTRPRPTALAAARVALILALATAPARSDDRAPAAAIPAPAEGRRFVVPGHPAGPPASPGSSGGWWGGTAVIAAALAVVGLASHASKRFLPARDSGPIRVVGRASLSPKHSVYLLRVGDRVLILGAGPQGAPTPLGEVTDPAELARLAPGRAARPAAPSFDRRIGGDE